MKTIKKQSLLFLIVIMLFIQSVKAQTWEDIGFNLPGGDTASRNTEITFANKNIGWLFTYIKDKEVSKVYKTIDGGLTWQEMKGPYGYNHAVAYSIEPDFFYMITGWNGSEGNYAKFTTDGGNTWDSASIGGRDFSCLHFFSEEKGIALSDAYSFITTDGGRTWAQKGMIVLPEDIYFYNENLGWAVGYGPTGNDVGYVAETKDGGNTWEYMDYPFSVLSGVTFIDSLKGFVVGAVLNAAYYQTTDGGKNWQIDTTFEIGGFDVEFLDDKNGWISSWGQIQKTTDGGETWENQFDNYINYRLVKLIVLKGDKMAYVLGINPDSNTATLLRADLSNITGVEENNETIPDELYLYQNYPNPFNPTTSIEYQVSRHETVILKIYDVLGNEIATLVNETKPPGTYKVNFNGSRLVSGIYIARLTAGKSSKAIKICFLK